MRIALATVGTTGDVVPFAALARALRAAGHDVTAISWELHRRAFEEAGASFAPAGPPTTWQEIARTAYRAAAASSPLAQVAVLRDFHLRDAEDEVRDRILAALADPVQRRPPKSAVGSRERMASATRSAFSRTQRARA
jgi:UDP:flavonoid glycosyltransferase YjiC (YdhE family)